MIHSSPGAPVPISQTGSDALQATAQQPDFQLYKLVNSSHNKPANVISGNTDQPKAHLSSVNLQLGRHMLLW